MYSIDINFLKDRPGYDDGVAVGGKRGPAIQIADRQALVAGVAVGVFPLALVGGWWLFTQNTNQNLQAELDKLTSEGNNWASKQSEVVQIRAQADSIKAETQGLASLFNTTIKPVSALLQDIRDRVPPGLQIRDIERKIEDSLPAGAPPPKPAAPPPPPAQAADPKKPPAPPAPIVVPWDKFKQKIVLTGTAKTFDDVNDFTLRLKQSQLLNNEEIKLVEAKLIDNPLQPVLPKNEGLNNAPPQVKLPQVVDYKIEAGVNDVFASQVVAELERKGAIGLATRIETLKEKGVIQP